MMSLWNQLKRLIGLFDLKVPQVPRGAALELGEHRGFTGENIVTLSTQDWTDLWTGKQPFMLQFAGQGNRSILE